MNPRDFLRVADEYLNGASEADWRSAVSRAYYAAFHVARSLLREHGFAVPASEKAHGYLWLRLSNCRHPDMIRTGADFRDLRQERGRADYDLAHSFAHSWAVRFVGVANDIVQFLDELPTVPAVLARIIDAIRVYERDVLQDVTWAP